MSFEYKINVLEELKKYGYNTNRLRKEHLLSEATIQSLRKGDTVGIKSLDAICTMLDCQLDAIIRHKNDWGVLGRDGLTVLVFYLFKEGGGYI